jgi:hypothetical protein
MYEMYVMCLSSDAGLGRSFVVVDRLLEFPYAFTSYSAIVQGDFSTESCEYRSYVAVYKMKVVPGKPVVCYVVV